MRHLIARLLSIITVTVLTATAAHADPFTISSTVPQPPPAITLDDPPASVATQGDASPFRWMHLRLDGDTPSPGFPGLLDPGRYALRLEPSFGHAYADIANPPTSIAEYVARGSKGNSALTAPTARKGSGRSRFDLGYRTHSAPHLHRVAHDIQRPHQS